MQDNLVLGVKVGKYVLESKLPGRHHYVAFSRDRRVVLKVANSDDLVEIEALRAEFDLLSRLAHPLFVKPLEWSRSGWTQMDRHVYYYSKPHVPGPPLEAFPVKASMLVPQVVAAYGLLFDGMASLHRAGLVHGDLRGTHFVLGEGGAARILDLGRAYPLSRSSYSSKGGAFDYVSPEHAEHLLQSGPETLYQPTPRDDVYAMGLLLYHLIRGKWPVMRSLRTAQGTLGFLMRVRDTDPEHPCDRSEGLPRHLADLAVQMVQPRPEDRPANAIVAQQRFLEACERDGDLVVESLELDQEAVKEEAARRSAPRPQGRLAQPPREAKLPWHLRGRWAIRTSRLWAWRAHVVAVLGALLVLFGVRALQQRRMQPSLRWPPEESPRTRTLPRPALDYEHPAVPK